MIKSKLRLSLGIFAVVAVMALGPGSALAQDSSIGTYAGAGGGAGNQVDQGADPASADATSGALPFTGLDLGLVVGSSLLLIGTGMALSRLVARDREA